MQAVANKIELDLGPPAIVSFKREGNRGIWQIVVNPPRGARPRLLGFSDEVVADNTAHQLCAKVDASGVLANLADLEAQNLLITNNGVEPL